MRVAWSVKIISPLGTKRLGVYRYPEHVDRVVRKAYENDCGAVVTPIMVDDELEPVEDMV